MAENTFCYERVNAPATPGSFLLCFGPLHCSVFGAAQEKRLLFPVSGAADNARLRCGKIPTEGRYFLIREGWPAFRCVRINTQGSVPGSGAAPGSFLMCFGPLHCSVLGAAQEKRPLCPVSGSADNARLHCGKIPPKCDISSSAGAGLLSAVFT